jgi:hypothetical protein
MKRFRTPEEERVGKNIERIFNACPDPVEIKLENFPKYVRRQHLKRFLALYELMKLVLPVKGSIIECGVFRGFTLMAWAKLSAMLEPEDLTRRIYGFDTFEGFPSVQDKDQSDFQKAEKGELSSHSYDELVQLIEEYDHDRFLGHIGKVELIRGDISQTVPEFIKKHQHLVVSLLFFDCDLFEPTKTAIEHFLPRMPKGAVIAFDELDNPIWPGETLGAMASVGINNLELRRFEWDPYISFAILK